VSAVVFSTTPNVHVRAVSWTASLSRTTPSREPSRSFSTRQADAQYALVLDYLKYAGLFPFVDGTLTPHGAGRSFHVTFRFSADEHSKTRILSILHDDRTFHLGPLGQGHIGAVGGRTRTDVFDFRSANGTLGPRSLEVMINRESLWGYADIDRYDLYGGLAPAFAHVFFEMLPHWIAGPQRPTP
jgi:hypothetical protein